MRVFIIAGEPSGDRLGGALMEGLKQLTPGVEFAGVGGAAMQGQGLNSQFDMSELSIMGIVEVAPKYFHLKRRIREVAEAALAFEPDVIVTIDSPDFCLRVATLVKAVSDIPTVHYVAPSVWAWREGRAAKMAKVIDHVLALLPFEPPLMQAAGMGCDFVGHPVVAEPVATGDDVAAFRTERGIGDAPLLLALPGSRRGEVGRLGDIFGEVLRRAVAERPDIRVVVPVAQGVEEDVARVTSGWPGQVVRIPPADAQAKRAAFAAADVALAASGTVSLELAAADTPMVIAYDMNWLTRQIVKRMIKIDTATLVNLVSETRAVPEFLGADCLPEKIAPALLSVLDAPGDQRAAMQVTMERLGRGGEAPGLRAARSVLSVVR
ncbi:lipid-A-disaccharide synthase [Aliiroseovarius sp.]|uniref:lipid-A-disaccharide synthase n=1 Tax=Aliiroseovarius sp. TaxID=1872442 RepID=UPI00262ABE4C|nr:lipid-A-disaccharide synthase [Aliiroseovarius sp.]